MHKKDSRHGIYEMYKNLAILSAPSYIRVNRI